MEFDATCLMTTVVGKQHLQDKEGGGSPSSFLISSILRSEKCGTNISKRRECVG